MSTDYSWIKKGVKAEIISTSNWPKLIGQIVTIEGYPYIGISVKGDEYMRVDIEETHDLAEFVGSSHRIAPRQEALKPFNPPDWEGIIDGTVECKDENTVYRYNKALEALANEWK